jgi:hypothetical protein
MTCSATLSQVLHDEPTLMGRIKTMFKKKEILHQYEVVWDEGPLGVVLVPGTKGMPIVGSIERFSLADIVQVHEGDTLVAVNGVAVPRSRFPLFLKYNEIRHLL